MYELILLINMLRNTPVVQDSVLTEIAQQRAEYLCTHKFSHDGWLEYRSDFQFRGENLAKGFKDMKSTNKAFMASPTHKKVMLNENYQYVGIGEACGITVEEFGGNIK